MFGSLQYSTPENRIATLYRTWGKEKKKRERGKRGQIGEIGVACSSAKLHFRPPTSLGKTNRPRLSARKISLLQPHLEPRTMQPPFDPAHGGALKRQFDESDPAPSPALSSPQMDDVTTAPTSAAPTPGPEAVDPAPPPKKLRVTLENKAAQGTLAAGGARDELQRRSDMFIRFVRTSLSVSFSVLSELGGGIWAPGS